MNKLFNWFRRDKMEHGLDRELHYHFDRRVSDLMQAGVPEAEARRQAMLELGGVTQIQEEVRDVWLTRWLRDFVYDLRFSARSFRRSPSFTITAVLSLALGIGATSAIYSLVDQVLLHALPVRQPENLVTSSAPHQHASFAVEDAGQGARRKNETGNDVQIFVPHVGHS